MTDPGAIQNTDYLPVDLLVVIRNFTCFLIPFFQADYLRVWTYLI